MKDRSRRLPLPHRVQDRKSSPEANVVDDLQFRRILTSMGLAWQGYRKVRKGVKKRLGRHMQELGCRDVTRYIERLEQEKALRKKCQRLLSVSISRFFRDRRLWDTLEKHILPELIAAGSNPLKVWSAGCACGEEAYSLNILWEQIGRCVGELPRLEITATDMNPVYLARARAALYPASSLREVPEEMRNRFFRVRSGAKVFRVHPALRKRIRWLPHSFFSPPPGSGFQLIFARNSLLTYYQEPLIRSGLEHIIGALAGGGYLIIGAHECLPSRPRDLQPCPWLPFAFRKGNPA
jgi:chemotaxis protein methyltransferase CheR